jgi:hypothetical protein
MPWTEGLDEQLSTHVAAKGWDKLEGDDAARELAKAHREAQTELTRQTALAQMGGVPKVPEPTDTAGWAELHKRLGKPEKLDDYKVEGLKFGDGSEPDAQFVGAVKQIAFDLDLPAGKANTLAARIMGLADADAKAAIDTAATRSGASDAELRRAWGGQHDYFNFQVGRAMELLGMPREVSETARASGPESYLKFMDGMRALASKMGEAELLRGDPSRHVGPALTRDAALERMSELKLDKAWGEKMMRGDPDAMRELDDLARIIAGPPSQNPSQR